MGRSSDRLGMNPLSHIKLSRMLAGSPHTSFTAMSLSLLSSVLSTFRAFISSDKTPPDGDFHEIRGVIISLLDRCDLPWPTVEYNHGFDAMCRAEAIRRGYPMTGRKSLAPFIHMGVVMATNTFAHLPESTQLFISVFTASLIYIDDGFQDNVDGVRWFNARFMSHERHGDGVLDCFSTLLLEMPQYFSSVSSNLIITSTLNLVTAMLLEYDTRGMKIESGSRHYPEYSRILSGAAEAYAYFAFPPEHELSTFVQAIPEMVIYINYTNDILSFYKEELVKEYTNYVSLLAAQRGSSKLKVLWDVSDDVVDAHHRSLEILEPQTAALEVYKKFANGYLGFHAGLQRYKLGELEI